MKSMYFPLVVALISFASPAQAELFGLFRNNNIEASNSYIEYGGTTMMGDGVQKDVIYEDGKGYMGGCGGCDMGCNTGCGYGHGCRRYGFKNWWGDYCHSAYKAMPFSCHRPRYYGHGWGGYGCGGCGHGCGGYPAPVHYKKNYCMRRRCRLFGGHGGCNTGCDSCGMGGKGGMIMSEGWSEPSMVPEPQAPAVEEVGEPPAPQIEPTSTDRQASRWTLPRRGRVRLEF